MSTEIQSEAPFRTMESRLTTIPVKPRKADRARKGTHSRDRGIRGTHVYYVLVEEEGHRALVDGLEVPGQRT